jgi:hypothetical protein
MSSTSNVDISRLHINSSGNIGIGTSAPIANLHITDTNTSNTKLTIQNNSISSAVSSGSLPTEIIVAGAISSNIGINEIATQIRQLILQTLNYNFDLQLQENDIDVLVDGNRLVMQVQPNLEQYINRIEIKNGLPNFIAEMIFVRMNNLTSDMNGEVNQDALIEPMQNLNIQEDNQQL